MLLPTIVLCWATVLSFKGSDHCLSFCFSAFPCGSTALTSQATAIPKGLFDRIQADPMPTQTTFSEDPSVLRKWRLSVAGNIVEKKERVESAKRRLSVAGRTVEKKARAEPADPAALLDVWMLPHAHCDVGWLMSVEGYFNPRHYDGTENVESVSNILSSVTRALDADASLRFIWSETKWIQMWWPAQSPAVQAAFRRIIKRGQFEFVGAGWSQNDGVTTAYYDVIDNQVTGHEYLRRAGLLDDCPQPGWCIRFGWQIGKC
eukprot:SAG22_NODE_444_length_10453_cov_8.586343_9_plen_261_part_00